VTEESVTREPGDVHDADALVVSEGFRGLPGGIRDVITQETERQWQSMNISNDNRLTEKGGITQPDTYMGIGKAILEIVMETPEDMRNVVA
jgi:hypothetical protein